MLAHTCFALSNASSSSARFASKSASHQNGISRSLQSLSGTSGVGTATRIASGGRFYVAQQSGPLAHSVGIIRGYAKVVRKLKSKKSSNSLSEKVAAANSPLELPKTLEENFGPITPNDLESWIAKGEAEDAARREAELAAKRAEEEEEEDEFDDEDFGEFSGDGRDVNPYAKYKWIEEDGPEEIDPDAPWQRQEGMEKKRKRSPPPFAPGRVMLDPDDWTHEKRDCLVEYVKKVGSEEETRHFGIVRRPVGLRHWGIVNLATGDEDRVNVYKIIWQWHGPESTQLDLESAQLKIDILKPIFDRTMKVLSPIPLWKKFAVRAYVKEKPSTRVVVPNLNTPRASSIVVNPGEEITPTLKRREIAALPAIETKEDDMKFIPIELATKVLFAEINKIAAESISEDRMDPMNRVRKAVQKDIEIINLLDEPSKHYLAHRFMYENSDYFRSNAHRGFVCRLPEQVLERLQSAEFVDKEKQRRTEFVNKLSRLMEQIRALDSLKDADTPVIAAVIPPFKPEKSGDNLSISALDTDPAAQAVTFSSEELQWIERLKQFALSGEDGEDEEVAYEILKPLGLGSRPHHAFQLLSSLSFISPYDNPHVLRYAGPKAFTKQEEELSLDMIELADGRDSAATADILKTKAIKSSSSPSSNISSSSSSSGAGQDNDIKRTLERAGYHESNWVESNYEKVYEELDAALMADEDYERRLDFGDLPAFAIDSQHPHEIDDAISIQIDEEHREWLWIHVTDVARYVKVGTKADDEARRRASSLYLPDSSYGIFPDPIRQHLSLGGPDLTIPDNQTPSLWHESPSINAKIVHQKNVPYGSISPSRSSNDASPSSSIGGISANASATADGASSASNSKQSSFLSGLGVSLLDGSMPTRKLMASRKRKQPTLSFGALIDGGGKIEEWRVVNGLISNIEHVTHEQLNEIMIPQEASDTAAQIRQHLSSGSSSSGTSRREKFLLSNSGWSPTESSSISTLAESPDTHKDDKRDPAKWTSGKSLSERLDVNLSPISERASELKRQYHETFIKLMDFATKRRAYRLERRATLSWMPKPEVRISVHSTDGASYISNLGASAHVSMSKDYNKNAQGVVTEMMLLAGQVAGHFARANSLPILYGTQDSRKQEHERSLLDLAQHANLISSSGPGGVSTSTPQEITKNIALRRSLKPPTLSTLPSPNVAQGLPLYVSVTSPLRRYLDLTAHHQIKAALRVTKPPFSLKAMHEIGVPLLSRTTEVNSLMKQASRFWVLHCLQQLTLAEPYRKFKALVIDARDIKATQEATLLLLDFGLETNITAPQLLMRGQTIHVRVDMVNPFYDTLILKEVKTVPSKRRKP